MNVLQTDETGARVDVAKDELLIVNNALNEICNGIEVFEFETRIGASRERVKALLKEVGALLARLPSHNG